MAGGSAAGAASDMAAAAGVEATSFASARNLGIASDAVSIGAQGVTWGFGIAKFAANTGFGVASACLRGSAAALEASAGPNAVSSALHGVNGVVGVAHKATTAGQDLAHAVTQASLATTKFGLSVAGAREGELLRLAIGEEAAEAILTVEATVRKFAGPLATAAPLPSLLAAARAWGAMQHAARVEAELHALPATGREAALPEDCERWLRFTAATFGAAWFAGLVDGFSPSAVARAREATSQGGGPGEAALACAGLENGIEVLVCEQQSRELFAPGYMVAVDHDFGRVVVALRGTSSVADALADLVCEPAAVQLGAHDGTAHGGMLRAAQRLEGKLAALAEEGLSRLPAGARRRVMICGHSLGAGVAALVAALWRDSGRFNGIEVECIAFACPQVLDSDLARAQSNHTTSIIVGDDLVPRFSLATAQDLRAAMLGLSSPAEGGLPPLVSTAEVLAAEARGDTAALAAQYAILRPEVCTSPGRLFPSGRLVHLRPGEPPSEVGHDAVDELLVSSDMATAHMPRRYLLAVQEALLPASRF